MGSGSRPWRVVWPPPRAYGAAPLNGLWSNTGNWDTPPVAGSDLVFPDGAANLTNTNDLPAGTSFASVTVSGSGYTIGGAAISLVGVLDASQAIGTDTINLPINFTGPAAVEVDQAGAVLVLGGVISGSGGLSKAGAGELDLTGRECLFGNHDHHGWRAGGRRPAGRQPRGRERRDRRSEGRERSAPSRPLQGR